MQTSTWSISGTRSANLHGTCASERSHAGRFRGKTSTGIVHVQIHVQVMSWGSRRGMDIVWCPSTLARTSTAGWAARSIWNERGFTCHHLTCRGASVVAANKIRAAITRARCSILAVHGTRAIGAALNVDIITLTRILTAADNGARVFVWTLNHGIAATTGFSRAFDDAIEAGGTCRRADLACVLSIAFAHARTWRGTVDPRCITSSTGGRYRNAAFAHLLIVAEQAFGCAVIRAYWQICASARRIFEFAATAFPTCLVATHLVFAKTALAFTDGLACRTIWKRSAAR